MLADLNRHIPLRAQKHIDPRTELDQADTLAGIHRVTRLLVADDAPRDQPCDLLEDHARGTAAGMAVDGNGVLLVGVAGFLFARDQKLALLILDAGNSAGDRRAV